MKIEVWSDVICPWCFIGKRRLERALERFDEDVEVKWRSFELDPSAEPRLTMPLADALARKYRMSAAQARTMMERVVSVAQAEGLHFDFDAAQTGNTFEAHQLIHFAGSRGLGAQMKERLLMAYFTEGRAIADTATLVSLAVDIGLHEDEARHALERGSFAQQVREDEAEARAIGAHGVPFFLIDGKYAVSGAQEADTLVAVFNQVRQMRNVDVSAAGSCDDSSCDV